MNAQAKRWLESLLDGESLSENDAERCMGEILRGELPAPWIAGFLIALRQKGESVPEITGFARAMRAAATPIACEREYLVDTCGTGGDGSETFNISTAAAFVAAGAGARVAKHGNRSVSSRCGSADVLEALGVRLELEPEQVGRAIDEIGFGFLFAPKLHSAMRHAVEPRRALAVRTVFNLLGPLTNPAGAPSQLMGVYDGKLLRALALVFHRLDAKRAIVVHGDDGLDELSVCAASRLVCVDGRVEESRRIEPAEFGLGPHPPSALRGGDARENARILRSVLEGEEGARRDIVLLNAGAAIWASGRCDDLEQGIAAARRSIDDGEARRRLDETIRFSQSA